VEVYPGCTHALADGLGAIDIVVAALRTPFTETCKVTVHPVAIVAGRVTLIWSSPANPDAPA
jgi:hypothetical protein